jgi:hypothetical protein
MQTGNDVYVLFCLRWKTIYLPSTPIHRFYRIGYDRRDIVDDLKDRPLWLFQY